VVKKHGTAKKVSIEIEQAIKEYLDRQEKQPK
jgi:predicted transcriptional regulator